MTRGVSAVTVIAVMSFGCTYASPNAGEEVVLVRQPYVFGHGGVEDTPVKTGASIIAWSTQALHVNVQPVTFLQHFVNMFTNDAVPLEFDVATKLRITDSVKMARDFGVWTYAVEGGGAQRGWPGWYGNNLMKPIENYVRQAVRKHGLNETAINPTAIDAIDAEVKAAIEREIVRIGLPVKLEGFTVGRATPPDAVKNQRIETAAQQQRQLTEVQRKLAEDAREAAERSRAVADNAYRNAIGMSPEQFIRLEAIHMQEQVCLRGGCTFISGEAVPLIGK